MPPLSQRLDEALKGIRAVSSFVPRVGLVLGSGLGAFGDGLDGVVKVPFAEIPHLPTPGVSGHAGALCLGHVAGVPVACLQGRSHSYEGHEADTVVFGVRLLAKLGCGIVLLTNAAGGIRPSFKPGTLMLISDHLNLTGKNPLVGPNEASFGPRFPDMTRAYDRELGALAHEAAREVGVPLMDGVYAAMLGPSYETPAEIHMLRTIGADAVGMSTAYEVIALRHAGVRAAAISCITNLAAGISGSLLNHGEVEETAREARDRFASLLTAWIRRMA